MFELVINKNTYQFNFGFGFVNELDPTIKQSIDGVKGKMQDMGLHFAICDLIDGNVLTLFDVLKRGNKGFTPRLEETEIEAHLDNPENDVEDLFKKVLGFLEKSNYTKKKTKDLIKLAEREKAKQEAQQEA